MPGCHIVHALVSHCACLGVAVKCADNLKTILNSESGIGGVAIRWGSENVTVLARCSVKIDSDRVGKGQNSLKLHVM